MTSALLDYEAVRARIGTKLVSRRRLETLSREGLFPRFVRLSPKGPALWSADDLDQWLASRLGARLAS